MTGRASLGLTMRAGDFDALNGFGKMVCTATDECIAYIIRKPPSEHVHETNRFDLFFLGVYTVWTLDDESEVDVALAFDTVPVVHAEDLACILLGPSHDFVPEGGVEYMEYIS